MRYVVCIHNGILRGENYFEADFPSNDERDDTIL